MKAFKNFSRVTYAKIPGILFSHIIDYPTPKNLSYLWSFGSMAGMCLIIQLVTGIFLAMHYTPEVNSAFLSIEHIMRNVNNGWLIRYIHVNGASLFFITIYCHLFRGIYYGSYKSPRIIVWISGLVIFLLLMATAFLGYVLPWGQMSFWGATVITNLFSAIPYIGSNIVELLWGGFSVDNATLNRFFSLHYLLPFIISGLSILHLSLLHIEGSNNPIGLDNKDNDIVTFYPYFYVKDLFAFIIFLTSVGVLVFFYPNILGHPDNYICANSLVTPAHIVPEWYFLPFYAILRSIPNKLGGVIAMISAIIILVLLPILNACNLRSTYFYDIFQYFFWAFCFNFLLLGWVGQKVVATPFSELGLFCTILYFSYFFFMLPILSYINSISSKTLK